MLPPGVCVFERGWLSSNNVLLMGDGDAVLVDSGYASHAALTLHLVKAALGPRQLSMLVNTHLHSDHCGGNALLQQAFPGLRTLVPPGLAEAVRHWNEVTLTYQPTGQSCPRFAADDVLAPGGIMNWGGRAWEVHAAPGHDPDSVIFFEPSSRTLISADALWENGFGVVFQELEGERAFHEVSATLDLIESLGPAVVIPGHGAVFGDVAPALERARSRLQFYRTNPSKHAAHAAKVLLKFKLLEQQEMSLESLATWASETPYFRIVQERWFPAMDFQRFIAQMLDALVRSRAAQVDAGMVRNT